MNPWTLALSNIKPVEHTHVCKNCGKGFSDAKPAQQHCSYECQRAWSNKTKVRRCKVCNKWVGSSYCDDHRPADWEAQKLAARKGKPKDKPILTGTCVVCSAEFIAKRPTKKYCSRRCKRRAENAAAGKVDLSPKTRFRSEKLKPLDQLGPAQRRIRERAAHAERMRNF